MAIAAVPEYLGQAFATASPGLRFGMYLKLWGGNRRTGEIVWGKQDISYEPRGQDKREREIRKENKVSALQEAVCLTENDKQTLAALRQRQQQLFATLDEESALVLDATAVAPFTTGLGNEHPLENGFAFLNPYGLPFLPGSGIKGVLRQAARELASGDWGEGSGWNDAAITALFGLESEDRESEHQRGALRFWDVIPQIKGKSLSVEIMTPHQKHYYQEGGTPHDCGQPVPISFLTLPPGSGFTFYLQCDRTLLDNLAPLLLQDEQWKVLLEQAFEHAFSWLGFGAKTAVGYGAMQVDQQKKTERAAARQRAREAEDERKRMEERAKLPPEQQAIAAFEDRLRADTESKGKGLGTPLGAELRQLVEAAEHWDQQWRQQVQAITKDVFEYLGVNRRKSNAAKDLWRRLND